MRHNLYTLLAAFLLADIYIRDSDSVYAWLWEKLLDCLDRAVYFF